MLHLSIQAIRHPVEEPPEPIAAVADDWLGRLHDSSTQITLALDLLPLPIRLPSPLTEQKGSGTLQWTHRRYDLGIPKPHDLDALEAAFEELNRQLPEVAVQPRSDSTGMLIAIGVDGLRTHSIHLRWLDRPPRIALLVTGLGDDLLAIRELLSHDARLSYAVVPFRTFAATVAERLRLANGEILADLREPVAPPADREERSGALVEQAFAALPSAVGAYWPDPADRSPSEPALLRQIRDHGGFLIVGASDPGVCREVIDGGVPCNNVAADIEDTSPSALESASSTLLQRARTDGQAIGTLTAASAMQALPHLLSTLQSNGVELVPVSQLLAETSLSRR